MRKGRPIDRPRLALGVEPSDPAVRALAGHAHRPSDVRDRHALLADPTNQQTTTMHGQPGVTVRHEDLRVVATANHHSFGGLLFTSADQSPTSRPGTSRCCRSCSYTAAGSTAAAGN